jgi:hypothetical protein
MSLSKILVPLIVAFAWINTAPIEGFEKVVIWGHKLHSHTHSYIHQRFFEAFKYLGFPTYWLDNQDDLSRLDLSNALFITEGQVDQNIPLRKDCLYILHNCAQEKYKEALDSSQYILLQVYTDDVLTRPTCEKIAPCIYYDVRNKVVYMPWASDLLPYEIDEMKKLLPNITKNQHCLWVGTLGGGTFGNIDQVTPFVNACKEQGIPFIQKSAMNKKTFLEEHAHAYLAPAIVGRWQMEKGYIPCRIFINICAGQLGITNSYRVYELFDKKILYNEDTHQLFYDAQERMKTWSLEEQYALMDFIKEHHTYLNRIETLLDFFTLID